MSLLLTVGLFALAWTTPQDDRPDEKTAPVRITSPKDGTEVEETEELEGQLLVKEGYPVVVVRPLAADQPWYVQGAVESVARGKFLATITLGDKKTKPGTKFRLVVLLAKNRAEALKFKEGSTLTALPSGLEHSDFVVVKRK